MHKCFGEVLKNIVAAREVRLELLKRGYYSELSPGLLKVQQTKMSRRGQIRGFFAAKCHITHDHITRSKPPCSDVWKNNAHINLKSGIALVG